MKENAAISTAEQRQAERFAPLQGRTGRISLSIEGQAEIYGILVLRDLSPFGVGIELSQSVETGRQIRLTYEESNLALEVVGTVAWQKQAKPSDSDRPNQKQYQLGIALCPANIAKNINFFRYMAGAQ